MPNQMQEDTTDELVADIEEDIEDTSELTLCDLIREDYLGQPLAILCARYWYRGIVSLVGKDFILLSNVFAVEVTGSARDAEPTTEDPLPGDMMIMVNAIEQACQPLWCWKGMDDFIEIPDAIQDMLDEAKKNAK